MFLFAYCVIIFVWVIVMYDDNYYSSSGHNGSRGKFSDRLNKIRRERMKRRCSLYNDDDYYKDIEYEVVRQKQYR